ncbi:hypothetical protein Xcc3_38510 [Xanthomonas campestris pv. campestris]|nr:hypothetical protein Xcc3_38510 [Xanthomonas campestris pv. campestris]
MQALRAMPLPTDIARAAPNQALSAVHSKAAARMFRGKPTPSHLPAISPRPDDSPFPIPHSRFPIPDSPSMNATARRSARPPRQRERLSFPCKMRGL